ncbi:MAG: glycosyltransferase, partial [Candidatus Methanoperedens sp.]|nr:glycosyltransferase [Candidatus Methanoperedens sp.]
MGLKIAITSTVSWPYVRRGSRITYELAVYLAKQGHEVHYISTKPGSISRKKTQDGVEVEYHRLIENPLLTVCKVQKFDTFSLSCLGSLLKNDYDIVQTTFPMDAFAASVYKSIKGTPFVHYMFDRFYPRYYITKYGKLVFNRCIRTASRIGTISSFIRDDLKEKFGVEGVVIPGTVDTEQFTLGEDRDLSTPCILSTSSLQEPRKRIDLLVKAFERLLVHMPNAVLILSGHTVPERTRMLLASVSPGTRKAIEILGVGRREDLPRLYRNAAITVLPSVNEAFGLVILESLASGTPVAGTRSGGIPDILNDPRTGVLFEEGDGPEELCKALLKGLELSRDPETKMRCRRHAEQYSWSKIGPLYEKLYSDALDGGQQGKSGIMKKKMGEKKIPASSECLGRHLKNPSNKKSLDYLFDDALDGLDIDYDNYYRIDLYKPFCTYILGWLFDNGVRKGDVLVIGFFTRPLAVFLEKCGFTVREVGISQRGGSLKVPENEIPISGLHTLKDIPGTYDVIICDDIIQYSEYPERTLQILRDKLNSGGKILLTIENAANCITPLHLLRGKNMHPGLDEN